MVQKEFMQGNYTNFASSDYPALIIFLIDIGGSMAKRIKGTRKTRIETVLDEYAVALQELVGRSINHMTIRPRYEIAMYAYSDIVIDFYGGVQKIDSIVDQGIPEFDLQNRKNMVFGFECVRDLLNKEIQSWTSDEKLRRPAPLVVHMTDAEISECYGNPVPIVKEIMNIEVPDGNVLVENIFFTDSIKMPTSDLKAFTGFQDGDLLGNRIGEMLFAMSSILPESLRRNNLRHGLNLQKEISMLFPGITHDFVNVGLADIPKS